MGSERCKTCPYLAHIFEANGESVALNAQLKAENDRLKKRLAIVIRLAKRYRAAAPQQDNERVIH